MNMNINKPLELETGAAPVFSVIWLHGLGADCQDFKDLPDMLELPSGLPVRFVLPNAPERPITLNGGMVMRGWYDLTGLEVVKQEDRAGLNEASQIVEKLVERECERGIPRSRIIVGGFSQGGAVALHYGLRCEQALAGIVGLSTYLPLSETLSAEKSSAAIQTPIFLAHGIFDPVLVLALGEASRQVLQENACTVEWRTYQMPHTVVPEELKDLSAWLLAKIWPAEVKL
ncbi:alpha/beta hydrolase fold domain-containing protein [Gammaproteobacteria bacterium]|jgi:phospholipase/carboxylesterase|nr:alpha/beta hydrolase fold domain-containing protein [Gammaproteobacteria bacterium]